MKIASVQMKPKVGNFEKNFSFIKTMIEKAAGSKADVVLFPELAISGYTFDVEVLKNGAEFFQNISDELIRLSRKYDMAIILGAPRILNGKIKNSLAVIKKKREILFYDKTHLFRKENEIFDAGESFLVFKFKDVIFGVLLCYEIGFPEISRVLTLHGAQVIFASFAFGRLRERIYDTATRARAIENGVYLVTSSTVGKGVMDFLGKSRIVHPSGKVMEELEDGQGMIISDIDLSILDHYRYEEEGDSHAYFKRRRPELYYEISSLKYPVFRG